MLKLMSLIDRRTDLTLGAFSEHWRTVHRELALRLVAPGIMRGYVQNHRLPILLEGLEPAGDGCPEVWVDSVDAVARLGSCPEYLEGAHIDEPNFMTGNARLIISKPAVLIDSLSRGEAFSATKLLLFLRVDRAAGGKALATLETIERPLLLPDAQPLRLEREIAVADLPAEMPAPAYDVIEASWWPDIATLGTAWMNRHDPAVEGLSVTEMAGMLVWELPVVGPPG